MAFSNLNEVCTIARGKTPISKAIPGDYPLVTTSEDRSTSATYDFDGKCVCIPMVSSTGHGHASLKRLHYQEGKFALGTILVALRCKDERKLLPKYLYIYLSVFKDELIVPLMKGSANVSLTLANLSTVNVFLPKIEKQKEIIKKFERCQEYFFELENNFKTQFDELNNFRDKVLQDAFAGRLIPANGQNEIPTTDHQVFRPHLVPEHWGWYTLSELTSKIGAGSTPKGGRTVYKSSGIAFLRSQNIQNGYVDLEDVAYIAEETHTRMKNTAVQVSDILLNITGASLGRSAIVPNNFPEANISQHVAIIRLNDRSLCDFIHLYILSPYFQLTIQKVQSGISREGLAIRELQKIMVPMPPRDERLTLVKKITDLFELHQQLMEQFFESVDNADKLISGLLEEIFFLNPSIKDYKLTSPFNFSITDIYKKKKHMLKSEAEPQKGAFFNEISIHTLVDEYNDKLFSFTDMFERTSIDYDTVKDIIFDLIAEGKSGQKPYLELYFDENNTGKVLFKLISV